METGRWGGKGGRVWPRAGGSESRVERISIHEVTNTPMYAVRMFDQPRSSTNLGHMAWIILYPLSSWACLMLMWINY